MFGNFSRISHLFRTSFGLKLLHKWHVLLRTSKTERERRLCLTVGLSYIYISELANGTEIPFILVRMEKEERV